MLCSLCVDRTPESAHRVFNHPGFLYQDDAIMCFIEAQQEVGGRNPGVMQVNLQNLQHWSLLVQLLPEQSHSHPPNLTV